MPELVMIDRFTSAEPTEEKTCNIRLRQTIAAICRGLELGINLKPTMMLYRGFVMKCRVLLSWARYYKQAPLVSDH